MHIYPLLLYRAMYTHRIMDITNQIVKQNRDIDKITADIRDLQKTINLSSATLQRADAITEELIFAVSTTTFTTTITVVLLLLVVVLYMYIYIYIYVIFI